MRREYKRQIKQKKAEINKSVDYLLMKNDKEKRDVKLNFLAEKPSIEYVNKKKPSEQETSSSLSVVLYDQTKMESGNSCAYYDAMIWPDLT